MIERIREALAAHPKKTLPLGGLTPAAVTVPVFLKNGEWMILLTRRTQGVRHHKGEISFPGGARDDGDVSLWETALRETGEEVGIQRDALSFLGELDDVRTLSRFRITPFVVTFSYPYPLDICRAEIDEILEVPITGLLDKNRMEEKITEYEGENFSVYYYYYRSIVIWGATAKILKQLLDIVDFN